jgi:FKBP-type peptidyl-prolyl cis-trans isomerase
MNRFPAIVSVVLSVLLTVAAGCASSKRSITTPSGLTYTVLKKGSGPVARAGQHVLIHETTSFTDGRVFYTTRNGPPLRFLLGGGQVIAGLDEGVTGMRVGERRSMIVPPKLSRRSSYREGLSPEDTLHYDVELVGIEP